MRKVTKVTSIRKEPASANAGKASIKGFRVETTGVTLAFNGRSLRFSTEEFWEFMDLLSNAAQDLAAAQVRRRKPAVE